MDRQPARHKHEVKKHASHPHKRQLEEPVLDEEEFLSEEDDYLYETDVQTILSWHATDRPFRQRSFEFFLNSALIVLAVEIILFLFSQYLLMIVVASLIFLVFALAIIPPRPSFYKITTEGVRMDDHVFIWEELYDFYFLRQHGQEVLHIRTKPYLPGELVITLGEVTKNQVKAALLPYLAYREYVKPTTIEQASDWLEKNFPLERKVT